MSASYNRIPSTVLEDVKSRVDLVALIGRKVELRKSGRSFVGLCPFHTEQTPSFFVDGTKGSYRCRGCNANGDAYAWVMATDNLPFWDALVSLANLVGVNLPAANHSLGDSERALARARNEIYSTLRQAQSLYVYGLSQHPAASGYLQSRGMTAQMVEAFGLGYVQWGIRNVLSKRVRDTGTIARAGVISSTADYRAVEVIRQRLTIPLRNERGLIVGFAGRTLDEGAHPKYINSPDTDVFQKSRELFGLDLARPSVIRDRSVVLVEGYFDVMTLHQAGETRAVAAMGTALSSAQAEKLWKYADIVYIAFDGDNAGAAATLRTAKTLLNCMVDGKQVRLIGLPAGEDPDSLCRKAGTAPWATALRESQSLSQYVVEVLCQLKGEATAESIMACALEGQDWVAACTSAPLYRQALRLAIQTRLGIEL